MGQDLQAELKAFEPQHDFFVGIDSDGCAFNSMEVKHNDSFSVNLIKYFGLAAISRQVHQVWDFVNLYSKTRGINRFKAIILAFNFLSQMPKVKRTGVQIPALPYLREWTKTETKLGNPALDQVINNATGARLEELSQIMAWSLDVNKTISEIVYNLPPFPYVCQSLQQLVGKADMIVVSATPYEALKREWDEHSISEYVALIAGQEMGVKAEHLSIAAKSKYAADHIIMIGDSPGDLKAAESVDALFFPVNPGYEEESWQKFFEQGIDKFLGSTYEGEYQDQLITEFDVLLPEDPPWDLG
jgi:phosphoglycolate phosphatase-like HAD superfamily hydrolase